jgi:hypothetical protein
LWSGLLILYTHPYPLEVVEPLTPMRGDSAHIHTPDGVLLYLVLGGWISVALALVAIAVRRVRGQDRKGVLAAAMVDALP